MPNESAYYAVIGRAIGPAEDGKEATMTTIASIHTPLRQLAVTWSRGSMPATQRERQDEIRALADRGGLSLTAARQTAEDAAEHCRIERKRRARRRLERHLGYTPIIITAYPLPSRQVGRYAELRAPVRVDIARKPVTLPSGTPQQRLRERRIRGIVDGLDLTMTRYERETAPIVHLVGALSDCGIALAKAEGWIEYSRRVGAMRGIVSAQYTISAMGPLAGCPRVQGGLLTLGAVRAPGLEAEGEMIWSAVWARQGRGEPVREAGYIVAREIGQRTVYAHGSTIGAARSVLSRSANGHAKSERSQALRRWQQAVRVALEAGRINGYDVPVRMSDARRAGLCAPGIQAWCARHQIDPAGEARVSELLAIQHDQREYVLAACLSAIRRQQRAQG
jgi:hypothetical protein